MPAGEDLIEFISNFGEENKHLAEKKDFKADGVAFISNCNDKSGRLDTINELRNFISIDIYGKCSDQNLTCERSDAPDADFKCMEMVNSSYKVCTNHTFSLAY